VVDDAVEALVDAVASLFVVEVDIVSALTAAVAFC
jgi:hypothetical protein